MSMVGAEVELGVHDTCSYSFDLIYPAQTAKAARRQGCESERAGLGRAGMSRHQRQISIHRAPRGSASGIGGVCAVLALARDGSTRARRAVWAFHLTNSARARRVLRAHKWCVQGSPTRMCQKCQQRRARNFVALVLTSEPLVSSVNHDTRGEKGAARTPSAVAVAQAVSAFALRICKDGCLLPGHHQMTAAHKSAAATVSTVPTRAMVYFLPKERVYRTARDIRPASRPAEAFVIDAPNPPFLYEASNMACYAQLLVRRCYSAVTSQ